MRVLLFLVPKRPRVHKFVHKPEAIDSPGLQHLSERFEIMASLIQRNGVYYIQHCVSGKARRTSTGTDSLQLAKEKLRNFESATLRGEASPLPTRTPIAQVVGKYVDYIRTRKTANSAQKDVYYLREIFGTVCPQLEITSRRVTENCRKRAIDQADKRRRLPKIEASCFEAISSVDVSGFISAQVQSRGLAPKTANRYREILCRVFNWAMAEGGVRMPGDKNPVVKVGRYKERAPEIRFLTLQQIDEQLAALAEKPQLQAMVATLIYAGLRREELLWLRAEDVDLAAGTYGMIRIRAKTVDGQSWQPKTKVNRVVPISSTLRRHLDRHFAVAKRPQWIFSSPSGKQYDIDNFSRDLRNANEAVGLVWSCLDYRHSFGSHLAQKGESLYKIATLMGNSPEICRRHYAALRPECLTEIVEFGHRGAPMHLGS